LHERGAATPVRRRPSSLSLLDEMLVGAIEGGRLEPMRQLLDASASPDGNPGQRGDSARPRL
jgi:hypothetical protein